MGEKRKKQKPLKKGTKLGEKDPVISKIEIRGGYARMKQQPGNHKEKGLMGQ